MAAERIKEVYIVDGSEITTITEFDNGLPGQSEVKLNLTIELINSDLDEFLENLGTLIADYSA